MGHVTLLPIFWFAICWRVKVLCDLRNKTANSEDRPIYTFTTEPRFTVTRCRPSGASGRLRDVDEDECWLHLDARRTRCPRRRRRSLFRAYTATPSCRRTFRQSRWSTIHGRRRRRLRAGTHRRWPATGADWRRRRSVFGWCRTAAWSCVVNATKADPTGVSCVAVARRAAVRHC